MPYPARLPFVSGNRRAMAHRHFWKDNVCCLSGAWRLCSWYMFNLPDFLPSSHFSRTRDLQRKRVCAPKAPRDRFAQPQKRLEGNLSFRFNPPTPPFNSSLFCQLSMFYKQARSTDNEPAGWSNQSGNIREEKSSTGNGRKFFWGKSLH